MSFIPGPATVSDAAAKLQSLLDAALAQPGVNAASIAPFLPAMQAYVASGQATPGFTNMVRYLRSVR